MPDVSATDLRAQLELGEPTAKAISPAVLAYIQKRGLYGQGRLSRLRSMLNPERFEHSRCVARLAGSLAKRWGQDPELALTAGMLHDCGRSIPAARMGSYAKRHRLKLPQLEATARLQPLAVHAHISERLARSVFGIENSAVLSAIRKHTLADRRMSPLDKVLYVADACSQDRSYPEAPSLRKLAFEDLDEAYKGCLRNKIEYCLRHDFWLHPLTLTAWNSLAR